MYSIFDSEIGLNRWLQKGTEDLQGISQGISDFNSVSSLQGGVVSNSVGTVGAVANGSTNQVNAEAVKSGEIGSILAFKKKNFLDTTEGWIQGMDRDGIYKWLIGGSTSSIDWAVTTPATLTVVGSITATSGTIGGWTIGATTLTGGDTTLDSTGVITLGTANNIIKLSSVDATYRIWVGNATAASAPFSITKAGAILATSGTVGGWTLASTTLTGTGVTLSSTGDAYIAFGTTPPTGVATGTGIFIDKTGLFGLSSNTQNFKISATDGSITSISGTIGAWNITSTVLRSGASDAASNVLLDPSNSLIRLGPTSGNYITVDGANQRIRSSNYSTGVSGFNVDPVLVEAENIIARGIMKGSTFQYDLISAVGGQVMVANSDVLASDMTALDASTLTTRGTTTWAVNDIIVIRQVTALGIQEEWLRVTSIASAPTYSVTRDLAGSFAVDTNPIWQAGTTVVKQGSSDGGATYSGGWLRLFGEGTNAPYYSVFSRTGVAYNTYTERVRLGNLNGFLDYVSENFGFAAGSSSGTNSNITIDPTNGIRLRKGTTNSITLDNSGVITVGEVGAGLVNTYISAGALSLRLNTTAYFNIDTSGNVSVGNTTNEHVYITSTGVQIKDGSSVYTDLTAGVLSLGLVSGGEYVTVDGTNGIKLYGGGVESISLSNAGTITIGEVGASKSNILISSNSIALRTNTTSKITLGTDGNISLTGSLDIGTAGALSSGATAILTGNGYYFSYNGGTPLSRVGTVSGGVLTSGYYWDGSSLTVTNSNIVYTFTCGENITSGNAVVVGNGESHDGETMTTDEGSVGTISGANWWGQSFTTSANAIGINAVVLTLQQSGGANTVTISIRSSLTGADIDSLTASQSVTSKGSYTFTFSSAVTVSPSTAYYIVIRESGANASLIYGKLSAGSGFNSSTDSGGSWIGEGDNEAIHTIKERFTTPGLLYKADASANNEFLNFVGFAIETITVGNSCRVNLSNVNSSQSGLSIGYPYYLSDTAGAISTTPGSVSKKIGLSLSATSLLILNT